MRAEVVFGLVLVLSKTVLAGPFARGTETGMVLVSGGTYIPFYGDKDPKLPDVTRHDPVPVKAFLMDQYPVTKEEFLHFVRKNSKWRKTHVARLFADSHYLEDWKNDLTFSQDPKSPATSVSWFAANAYCHELGKELPTTDQWEYAAADVGRGSSDAKARILSWYAKPNPKRLPRVGTTPKNGFGVYDLFGLVWEWTVDFNNATVSEESRDGGTTDQNLFCGNGSQGALDSTDYASFMRYSFRSSLKANYSVGNLGFRCVKGAAP